MLVFAARPGFHRVVAHRVPFLAQGVDQGGHHQSFDVIARGIFGPQRVALFGTQGALHERAENRRFDLFPVLTGGTVQDFDLGTGKGDDFRLLEQLAVEVGNLLAQGERITAGIHLLPQLSQGDDKALRRVLRVGNRRFEQFTEGTGRQQAHVFGKHGKQAAGEKSGNFWCVMSGRT